MSYYIPRSPHNHPRPNFWRAAVATAAAGLLGMILGVAIAAIIT